MKISQLNWYFYAKTYSNYVDYTDKCKCFGR